ncbi:MAG: GNAT family N-acetyltransferase [Anaerolineae bacterium]|nr:GNAT family N-acetyltransferase [Anaerolineae bacterium]
MTQIKIDGAGITVRDWILDDLEVYRRWLQPGQRWQELDGPYFKKPTPDEIPPIIERIRSRIEAGSFSDPRHNLIIAEAHHNRLIGQVSRYWISEETHWLAAGLVIYDPALWGRGYGTTALGLWTDYLFQAFPAIVRLDLQTWSGNIGMMRLAAKLGYQLEGRFRKARIVAGEYHDALGYGILREEWMHLHPHGFTVQSKEELDD